MNASASIAARWVDDTMEPGFDPDVVEPLTLHIGPRHSRSHQTAVWGHRGPRGLLLHQILSFADLDGTPHEATHFEIRETSGRVVRISLDCLRLVVADPNDSGQFRVARLELPENLSIERAHDNDTLWICFEDSHCEYALGRVVEAMVDINVLEFGPIVFNVVDVICTGSKTDVDSLVRELRSRGRVE